MSKFTAENRIGLDQAFALIKLPFETKPEVKVYSEDVESFGFILQTMEFAIAERLNCDVDDDGIPMTTGASNPYDALRKAYDKKCSTKPNAIFADFMIDSEAQRILAEYWLPFAGMGRQKEAVHTEYLYSHREKQVSGRTLTILGRQSLKSVHIVKNPFFITADKSTETGPGTGGFSTMTNRRSHGMPLNGHRI